MITSGDTEVGDRYRSSRLRSMTLLESITESDWVKPVPACPGWRVRDVLAHLVGVIEDAADGQIAGPPSPAQTASEVDRHRADDPGRLLRLWSDLAPAFEARISEMSLWPALIDVISHEHDMCGALGVRGERDHPDVIRVAKLLTHGVPGGIFIELDGRRREGDQSEVTTLRVNSFEFLRLRLGRRSRSQVEQLDWSADPAGRLDGVFVFGPADFDLVE